MSSAVTMTKVLQKSSYFFYFFLEWVKKLGQTELHGLFLRNQ